MQECTNSGKLEELQKALDDFDKVDLEDKGDRQRAVERITFLRLRKGTLFIPRNYTLIRKTYCTGICFLIFVVINLHAELKDAIARRHGEKLEEAIENAKQSKYEENLQNKIREAEELLAQLRRLNRFAHEVLKMQQPTISEIHNYRHPKPLAYEIMKATYILLGEEEGRVEVSLLKRSV